MNIRRTAMAAIAAATLGFAVVPDHSVAGDGVPNRMDRHHNNPNRP